MLKNDEWQGGYKYFTEAEMMCKGNKRGICTCKGLPKHSLMEALDKLREIIGAIPVSSGYRCPTYNAIVSKAKTHTTGYAVDITLSHEKAIRAMVYAYCLGFKGFGVSQKGDHASRFIHLDMLQENRPAIWSY